MADFEWSDADCRDLVRRERRQALVVGTPVVAAAALLALWVRTMSPNAAALFGGMALAWLISVVNQVRTSPARWTRLLTLPQGPVSVRCGDDGITWSTQSGARALRWGALRVKRLGATWLFSVHGQEVAFLPHRALTADGAILLEERAAKG